MVKITISGVLSLLAAGAQLASGAQLTRVNNFGANPTGVEMWVYVPDKVASNPAIIVASHWCTGTAQAMYSGTQYARLAETYGYIVIYPDAPDSGGCWDIHTTQTLTHNGGGDSLGIASMVRYAITQYRADASRVFGVGISSGGMMSQALAAVYPELFAGISAWAGVPAGCFAGPNMWNSQCAQGQLIKTAQAWGDQVRAMYPGYTGRRPKVQIVHGTADDVVYFNNWNEAIKQWTNVLNYPSTPVQTQTNSPVSGWTRQIYGPNFQAIKAQGVPHNVPHQENDVLAFFGLNTTQPPPTQPGGTTSTTTRPVVVSPTPTPTPPPTGGATVPKWGQCGGIGYSGPTTCAAGSTCRVSNAYYSQCL